MPYAKMPRFTHSSDSLTNDNKFWCNAAGNGCINILLSASDLIMLVASSGIMRLVASACERQFVRRFWIFFFSGAKE